MGDKRVILNVDYFDQVCEYKDGLYEEKQIEHMCARAVEQGVDTLFWRVSGVGKAVYPSKTDKILDDHLVPDGRRIKDVLEKMDPLKVGIECARKYGLGIYIWMTMYDDFYPKMVSRLVEEHPECQWVDKSGEIYFSGVMNYCYEEVRKYKMELIKELAEYNADGIFLSMRSHAPHCNSYNIKDMYGFNKPVVEEYKKRFGVDVTEYEDVRFLREERTGITNIEFSGGPTEKLLFNYDDETWQRVKGEYHNSFIKDVGRYLKENNQNLLVTVTGDYTGIYPLGLTNKESVLFHSDYESWIDEGVVDGIVVMPKYQFKPYMYKKPCPGIEQELEQIRRYKEDVGEKTKIYLWYDVHPDNYGWNNIKNISSSYLKNMKSDLIDGIILHELMIFEFDCR